MTKEILTKTVGRLLASPKGILAADESANTCKIRFEALGIPNTEENRRTYRELLITTPGLEQYISGFILFDETIRQSAKDGKSFIAIMNTKGLDVGIKVDQGLKDLPDHPGEKYTEGIEGLEDRLQECKNMGTTFAKWRAVYTISDSTPSEVCMKRNADALAKYALLCQEKDIVPIIEPEVLLDGSHSIEKCFEVTARNFDMIFSELRKQNIFFPGVILKTSMVLSGRDSTPAKTSTIRDMTLKCLTEHVPPDIGGIVFLSGGQGDEEATINLNAMHKVGNLPWPLTFSYSRALQNPVLKYWAEHREDIAGAQKVLLKRARDNSLASLGQYE